MEIKDFLTAFLAFIALVNPLQKLLVVVALKENYERRELHKIINRSNRTALEVLIVFMLVGEFILNYLFNIQVYAFQATCGLVLLYNGLAGLQKGTILPIEGKQSADDLIAVPIAVPMIAGPATITAAVSMPGIYGKWISLAAILSAIAINWLLMRYSGPIAKLLIRYNILQPLVRIMGLIVAAIGCQMIFNAITVFIHQL